MFKYDANKIVTECKGQPFRISDSAGQFSAKMQLRCNQWYTEALAELQAEVAELKKHIEEHTAKATKTPKG